MKFNGLLIERHFAHRALQIPVDTPDCGLDHGETRVPAGIQTGLRKRQAIAEIQIAVQNQRASVETTRTGSHLRCNGMRRERGNSTHAQSQE